MALRRFGVPDDIIRWFLNFDKGNNNRVLTAFEDTEPFEAEMGAWAQDDDFPPIGWVVTMDWMLQVVVQSSNLPVKVGESLLEALMYADDASYLQGVMNAVKGVLETKEDAQTCLSALQADATE